MYLLDTNVVSETRRARPHGGVLSWLAETPDPLIKVPGVVIGEIQAGIERIRASDPGRADALDAWLDAIGRQYDVPPMDGPMFRAWAKLMNGRPPALLVDAMVAATAEVLGLVVVTRNLRDFAVFGTRTLNPFEARPG